MSNKKRNILIVILLIVTNIITFSVGNVMALKTNNKVIISNSEYKELLGSYSEQSKANMLKTYIKDNFLYEVEDEILDDGQLYGIFNALGDPYSGYLNKDDFKELREQSSGRYGGIGVVVSPGEDGLITVVSPIANTPGEKSGLRTEDKIIKIDGKEFKADEMNKAVKHMKGKPKTKVTLTILRPNGKTKNEIFDLELMREDIKLETVYKDRIDDLGYIKLTSFDEESSKDFSKALKDLEAQGVKGLVLDLRNNPGGLLNICRDIADEFLDEGDIVYTETRAGKKDYIKSKNGSSKLPLVVLVNGGSASASEILSGALQDRERALIVGEKTFGKGIVQSIKPLDDGTAIKLTESEYFTPKGHKVHGQGIEPDQEVKLPEDVRKIGPENLKEDKQLQKAIELLKK